MTALVCLTALLVLWRAEPYVDRLVTVHEQRAQKPQPRTIAPIPPDLMLSVQAESEGWAREQATQRLYEQYDAMGSWDAVRQTIGRSLNG